MIRVLLLLATSALAQAPDRAFDVTSIQQVVLDYQVAFLAGDTAALKKTVTEGFLKKVGGESFFFAKVSKLSAQKSGTAAGRPATTATASVIVREVSKYAAVAGFRENEFSPWGFFRLKKDPTLGWRIDAPIESH